MQHRFSLATLLLVVAIAAVALASVRSGIQNMGPGQEPWMILFGFLAGGPVGLGVAIWNRSGWLRGMACQLGGFALGAAAGAQTHVTVNWPVVFAAPIVLIGTAALVALNQRRATGRGKKAQVE